MAFIEETLQGGLQLREFTVAGDARPVTGVLWQPPDALPGAPTVCCGHGASGDRHQAPIPWLAQRLVGEYGFNLLSIDGPVHGRRQVGVGGRDAFWPEWRRDGTADDMTADWKAALDFIQAQPDVGAGPIGYWGLSMGTIYGAPFVAAEPRISAAVLGLMGITGPDEYRPVIQASAEAISIPVFFIMQLEDELFSRDECLALFDALASDDKRLHANTGLHSAVPMEELSFSVDFLVQGLLGASPDQETAFSVLR
jgi:dienelactone hydrolase